MPIPTDRVSLINRFLHPFGGGNRLYIHRKGIVFCFSIQLPQLTITLRILVHDSHSDYLSVEKEGFYSLGYERSFLVRIRAVSTSSKRELFMKAVISVKGKANEKPEYSSVIVRMRWLRAGDELGP